jgi:hypothetical protein
MKQRTPTYLGSFVNSPEGISSYKLMVKTVRQTVVGGRFVKMFRGNPKPRLTNRRDGSTHFDVYLLARVGMRSNRWVRDEPKFFNFVLHR